MSFWRSVLVVLPPFLLLTLCFSVHVLLLEPSLSGVFCGGLMVSHANKEVR